MTYTLARYVITIGPYLMLACGASLLWKPHTRLPAVRVAAGFSAVALSPIAAAYVSFVLSAAVNSTDGIATFMQRLRHWQWLTQDLGPLAIWLGIWTAALGLLAHALRQPPPDPG